MSLITPELTVENYLKNSESMIPLISPTDYRMVSIASLPRYAASRSRRRSKKRTRKTRRTKRRRVRKSRKHNRKIPKRNPITGRFMKSK